MDVTEKLARFMWQRRELFSKGKWHNGVGLRYAHLTYIYNMQLYGQWRSVDPIIGCPVRSVR